MFSQFFEKKKSSGFSNQYYSKRKRQKSPPGQSSTSMLRYFSPKSNSPSPHKVHRMSRKNSPYISPRLQSSKMSYGKLLNLNHLRIKHSQSPRGGRSNILNFFKTRDTHGTRKKHKDKKMRTDEYFVTSSGSSGKSTRKLINILGDKKSLKNRMSGDNSRTLNKSESSMGKKRSDLDRFMSSKRKANREFLLHAKNNTVEKCLEILGGGRKKGVADINAKDSEGWTAMHHAAWNGNLKFINILLYNDALIEVKDKSGVNCLTLSVARGHSSITQVRKKTKSNFSRKKKEKIEKVS